MKWRFAVVVCLAVFLVDVPRAVALDEGDDLEQIPSCGAVTISHELWQYAQGGLWVSGFAQSRRNLDGCVSQMRIEAWIEGITMPTMIRQGYGMAVSVAWTRRVPNYGRWNSVSKHWLVNFGAWLWNGYGHGTVDITPIDNPTTTECTSEDPCELTGGGGPDSGSPVILDVNDDGFDLTSVSDGVRFDLDGDGVAEQVSWTRAGSDDAWLALDRNRNGQIDDGGELFGNYTPAYPDQRTRLSANGFDALKFLEGPDFGTSNGDGTIDARDSVFGTLLLWTDLNHNGISEPGELSALSSSGVVSLSTDYKEIGKRDRYGNRFKQRADSTWNIDGILTRRHVYDVWLCIER